MTEAPAHPHNVAREHLRRARRHRAARARAALQPHARRDPAPAGARRPAHRRGAGRLGRSTRPGSPSSARRARWRDLLALRSASLGHEAAPLACGPWLPWSASTPIPTTSRSPPAGTMAKAAAAGHDVVLVVATRGELGETRAGGAGRRRGAVGRRGGRGGTRRPRCWASHRRRVPRLRDSGMMGEPTNDDPAVLLAGRRRPGGRRAGRHPHRGRLRRVDHLRRPRQLRPSRPHPGAPGGPAGRPSWPASRWCSRPP